MGMVMADHAFIGFRAVTNFAQFAHQVEPNLWVNFKAIVVIGFGDIVARDDTGNDEPCSMVAVAG